MLPKPTKEAYRLMHEGAMVFAAIEQAGMRVDVDVLNKTVADVGSQIKRLEAHMRTAPMYERQQQRYGEGTNLTSRDQLATVLLAGTNTEDRVKTASGKDKLDNAILQGVGGRYAERFIQLEKLNKVLGTYLLGLQREVEGQYMHPFFNLHRVLTYRSSSDSPNFQNIPIRDPFIAKLIRSCFIARRGHRLVEIDISGAEVRVAACYHEDPTMLNYINDPTTDMHRDMARECFMLNGDVPKGLRSLTKGGFVFAEFYGDYYRQVCQNLWGGCGSEVQTHLAAQGITSLGACSKDDPIPGTFEHHIKEVEAAFWGTRFPVYAQWKKDWYAAYRKAGGFHTLTGFTLNGLYTFNAAVNYPIQGSAFHCLLWCLIRLHKEMRRKKMRSVLVGQIHDSIVGDIHENELDDFLAMVKRIMTVDLLKAWPWIITPMEIDAEVAPAGGSWYDKQEVTI